MQWNGSDYAGFTNVKPYRAINSNYTIYNVETQLSQPSSILHHYKKLIAIRNSRPAIMDGDYELIMIDAACWAFIRKKNDEIVLVILNFSSSSKSLSLNFSHSSLSSGYYEAGSDLLDQGVNHPALSDANRHCYSIMIPALGTRIVPFSK